MDGWGIMSADQIRRRPNIPSARNIRPVNLRTSGGSIFRLNCVLDVQSLRHILILFGLRYEFCKDPV